MIWELRGKYENLFLYRTKSETGQCQKNKII